MDDNYSMSYIHMRAGKYVVAFLKPYMEKYNLRVDLNTSTLEEIILVGEDGVYAGKIEQSHGASKYIMYLDKEGTIVVSGEVRHNHVSGVVERLNRHNKGMVETFTTFTTDYFTDHIEGTKNHYSDRVPEITSSVAPPPTNWTWNEIYRLFMLRGRELKPQYVRKYENVLPEEFMSTVMTEYETPNYTQPKITH